MMINHRGTEDAEQKKNTWGHTFARLALIGVYLSHQWLIWRRSQSFGRDESTMLWPQIFVVFHRLHFGKFLVLCVSVVFIWNSVHSVNSVQSAFHLLMPDFFAVAFVP